MDFKLALQIYKETDNLTGIKNVFEAISSDLFCRSWLYLRSARIYGLKVETYLMLILTKKPEAGVQYMVQKRSPYDETPLGRTYLFRPNDFANLKPKVLSDFLHE